MDKEKKELKVRSTQAFKLKDKPGRGGIMVDLKTTFGFLPKKIIIQKVTGQHDKFVLRAVIEKGKV